MPAVKHNKQNVSVTLDPILVKQAREIGINLSQTLTSALKAKSTASKWHAGKKKMPGQSTTSMI
jgi:post-segregation antitoxin (ccd killing protein)